MQYTTTSCKKCGYKTRNFESGIPDVQIGTPIIRCPKCDNLIVDGIATEFEFMTEKEKAEFSISSESRLSGYIIKNSIIIIIGIIVVTIFATAATVSEDALGGIFFGFLPIIYGVYQILHNIKLSKIQTIEQAIYESLQRTQNSDYVGLIELAYASNGIYRKYAPIKLDKYESFINKYKHFESRESYIENMRLFNELMNSIENEFTFD